MLSILSSILQNLPPKSSLMSSIRRSVSSPWVAIQLLWGQFRDFFWPIFVPGTDLNIGILLIEKITTTTNVNPMSTLSPGCHLLIVRDAFFFALIPAVLCHFQLASLPKQGLISRINTMLLNHHPVFPGSLPVGGCPAGLRGGPPALLTRSQCPPRKTSGGWCSMKSVLKGANVQLRISFTNTMHFSTKSWKLDWI